MKCLIWKELKCSERFVFKISRIAINSVYLWYKMHRKGKYSIIKCKISQIKEIWKISRRSHFEWGLKAFVWIVRSSFRKRWKWKFNSLWTHLDDNSSQILVLLFDSTIMNLNAYSDIKLLYTKSVHNSRQSGIEVSHLTYHRSHN